MSTHGSRGSKFGSFIFGFFVGILISGIAAFLFIRYMMDHPQVIVTRAQDLGMNKVVEKVVEKSVGKTISSIPQDVVQVRQDDINRTVQNFTEAYAGNRITPMEMQLIAGKFFGLMADQQITPQEMDEMLNFMNEMAK